MSRIEHHHDRADEKQAEQRQQLAELVRELDQHGAEIQKALATRVKDSDRMSVRQFDQLSQMRFTDGRLVRDALPKDQLAQLSRMAEAARNNPALAQKTIQLSSAQREAFGKALTNNQLNNASLRMAWDLLSPKARAAILDQAVRQAPQSAGTSTAPKTGEPPAAHPQDAKEAFKNLEKGTARLQLQQALVKESAKKPLDPGALKFTATPAKEGSQSDNPQDPKLQLRLTLFGSEGEEGKKLTEFYSKAQEGATRFVQDAGNRFIVPENPQGASVSIRRLSEDSKPDSGGKKSAKTEKGETDLKKVLALGFAREFSGNRS